MVIYCKHCGAALRVDEARMPTTAFRVKCHQCHNLLTVEPPKASPADVRTVTPIPIAAPPRPPAAGTPPAAVGSPAGVARPAERTVATAVVVAPQPEARPFPIRTHYLQKIKLFSALSYEECVVIESRLKPREFAPLQAIVKEGGPGDSMFVINAGTVEVRKRDPNTGIDFLLTELKTGACFGEMALLTGKPRAATVIACLLYTSDAADE